MEFGWAPEDVAFRAELRAFLDEELPEHWHGRTAILGSAENAEYSHRFAGILADRNWLIPHWPDEYGGSRATPWQMVILSEELWSRGEPRGPQYMNANWIGPSIMANGTEAQRQRYLPPIARGQVVWCQGFSEPDAGSDLAALRTEARLDGDEYVVNGSKIWTSYVNGAEFCFLLVRTDPNSKRNKGITVLLAPMDAPGIEVREIPSVVGERYFHELFFADARIPVACRLGPEGEGWDVVSYALAYERVGAMRYARAALMLDAIAAHAKARGLVDDPGVQEKLGAARAAVEAARLLSYRVIDLRARGSAPTADTNLARVAGTLCENAVSDLALELFGPDALEYGHAGDAYFRLAMTAGVAVGTTEINLNLIASRMLDLPRE